MRMWGPGHRSKFLTSMKLTLPKYSPATKELSVIAEHLTEDDNGTVTRHTPLAIIRVTFECYL